mgnify:FL=1
MKFFYTFCLLLITISGSVWAQTARIKGVILNEENQPLEGVSITADALGTISNVNGFYSLKVPANQKIKVVFSFIGYKNSSVIVQLNPNEDYEFNPVLNTRTEQIGEVVVVANRKKIVEGLVNVTPATLRLIPGANPGVENILKTLPGVYSNSDLSTQYAVRGGNYEENLVYVNEIEVYRPFLIRSGEQEGLSFTNTDLVQNIDFSAGGFQAKYGDKLSSVLDIAYKNPKKFAASADVSRLGVNAAVEQVSKNQKWAAITGARYRDNSLLVNSMQTQANYKPAFTDIQTLINYKASLKWQWSFLGNIANNKYDFQPLSRVTRFGTLDEQKTLFIFYEGQERDRFTTYFGAVKSNYQISEKSALKFIGSAYHTAEVETFDIWASYRLEEETNVIGNETIGDVTFGKAIGSQLTHARNYLDALIYNFEVKGVHGLKKSSVDWGLKYTRQDIRDRQVEWEVIDSAGFVVNPNLPPNNQPYEPHQGQLDALTYINAKNFVTINRISGFTQWNKKWEANENQFWFNSGVRFHQWQVNVTDGENGKSQIVFSPRAQFAVKPNWKREMIFRLSGGWYHQPPFYRELRDLQGIVQPNVKAQQSIHTVLSADYSFKMWDRPFKMVSEVYYKHMTDVNTYSIDNVRIRYRANNNAEAYATGLDFRLNGEFVPGTESWFSLGILQTKENQDDKGYIARPTDQRVKVGVLFQDYVPNFPNCKVYLNMVYSTGMPGGAPSGADVYQYQGRLPNYRRADVGFAYVLIDGTKQGLQKGLKYKFKELTIGGELFNIFNIQNSNTNIWVRDVSTQSQYAIPNYMTSRVLNFRVTMKL